ncbi:MAG: hypothetical protein HYZ79_04675 [Candidatus Melainabacteria bacterium]|nr:hypothetical protein [Candidatus Melainabacteria bacterium]
MTLQVAMKPSMDLIPVSQSANRLLKNRKSIKEIIFADKTKKILNYACNGSASAFGFFTFISANFHLLDPIQEHLDFISEKLERLGNGLSGIIGAIDLWQKKNFLPFIGYTSMVPISALISGYDNWLARGISIGLNSFIFIIDRREVVDKKGNPILDKSGKKKYLSGDFSDTGWIESIKTSCDESVKMIKELFDKPQRITTFSHAALLSSLFQMTGPIISASGLKSAGASIRNVAGITGYLALLLDKRKEGGPFGGINLKSPVVQCSLLRIGTAIFDMLKHFDFFSSRISNLTDISLALDRLAGLRFTKGIFDIKKVST